MIKLYTIVKFLGLQNIKMFYWNTYDYCNDEYNDEFYLNLVQIFLLNFIHCVYGYYI